jgi:hypothetical protein
VECGYTRPYSIYMRNVKLTDRSMHLVACLLKGQYRLFALDDAPPGFIQLERAGLVERCGRESARFTAAGRIKFGQPVKEWSDPR